jgi:hypothetical protein
MFAGDDSFSFTLSRVRVYEDKLFDLIGKPPPGGQSLRCLVILQAYDADEYTSNATAAAVYHPNDRSMIAGYFTNLKTQRFKKGLLNAGIAKSETLMCLGEISGGQVIGRFTLPYSLRLDLTFPLRIYEDSLEIASRFVQDPFQRREG